MEMVALPSDTAQLLSVPRLATDIAGATEEAALAAAVSFAGLLVQRLDS